MESKEEIKESMERNKEIRASENERMKTLLKNSTEDKEMREHYSLMNKKVTRTSRDDARERRLKKFLIGLGIVILVAGVGVALYFLIKK